MLQIIVLLAYIRIRCSEINVKEGFVVYDFLLW